MGSSNSDRKLSLLYLFHDKNILSIDELEEATNIARPTIRNLIANLRHEYLMDIHAVKLPNPEKGDKTSVYYIMRDWGCLLRSGFGSEDEPNSVG